MKKILMCIIMLIIFSSCTSQNGFNEIPIEEVPIEDESIQEYTTEKSYSDEIPNDAEVIYTQENGLIYINEEDGYIFDIPDSWEGKFIIEPTNNNTSVAFRHKTDLSATPDIFSIYIYTQEQYDAYWEEPDLMSFIKNELDGTYLGIDKPIASVGYKDEELENEYLQMIRDLDNMHKMFKFIKEE